MADLNINTIDESTLDTPTNITSSSNTKINSPTIEDNPIIITNLNSPLEKTGLKDLLADPVPNISLNPSELKLMLELSNASSSNSQSSTENLSDLLDLNLINDSTHELVLNSQVISNNSNTLNSANPTIPSDSILIPKNSIDPLNSTPSPDVDILNLIPSTNIISLALGLSISINSSNSASSTVAISSNLNSSNSVGSPDVDPLNLVDSSKPTSSTIGISSNLNPLSSTYSLIPISSTSVPSSYIAPLTLVDSSKPKSSTIAISSNLNPLSSADSSISIYSTSVPSPDIVPSTLVNSPNPIYSIPIPSLDIVPSTSNNQSSPDINQSSMHSDIISNHIRTPPPIPPKPRILSSNLKSPDQKLLNNELIPIKINNFKIESSKSITFNILLGIIVGTIMGIVFGIVEGVILGLDSDTIFLKIELGLVIGITIGVILGIISGLIPYKPSKNLNMTKAQSDAIKASNIMFPSIQANLIKMCERRYRFKYIIYNALYFEIVALHIIQFSLILYLFIFHDTITSNMKLLYLIPLVIQFMISITHFTNIITNYANTATILSSIIYNVKIHPEKTNEIINEIINNEKLLISSDLYKFKHELITMLKK